MVDIVLIALLALIVGGAGFYLYKAKKKGRHCIGCPYSKQCSSGKCSYERDKK